MNNVIYLVKSFDVDHVYVNPAVIAFLKENEAITYVQTHTKKEKILYSFEPVALGNIKINKRMVNKAKKKVRII